MKFQLVRCSSRLVVYQANYMQGQSLDQLTREFQDIRQRFNSRYVRLYGACDREGF